MKLARIEKAQSVFYFSYLEEEHIKDIMSELEATNIIDYSWAFDEDLGLQLLVVDMDDYHKVKNILVRHGATLR